ncbi:MAG: hypothetical protein JXA57_15815 [Armatimonadetes bacterium]|nr:hypothetical protein [Armatimonadota bacterium]
MSRRSDYGRSDVCIGANHTSWIGRPPMCGAHRLYTNEELLCRPIEHVIEDLSCAELARAIGCSKDTAWHIKRGNREADCAEVVLLERWLQTKLANTTR